MEYMERVDLMQLKKLSKSGKVVWKEHALQRMTMRRIKRRDVIACILSGEIIEDYPEDYPVPSCLVLGSTEQNKMLYVVCSIYQEMLCVITAYYPDKDRWETDLKTRKVES